MIIFDLDDTLVETTACWTPVKLEGALREMMREGLEVSDFEEALSLMKRLDETAQSSSQTLAEFLEMQGGDIRFLDIGMRAVYETDAPDVPLFPAEGAHVLLEDLKRTHHLAIVTNGFLPQQMNKMKKAGIDSGIFSKIVACEGDKKPHYEAVVQEFSFSPAHVVVCGDRVARDLVPAKELGYKTIHIKNGRGARPHARSKELEFAVDFAIQKLEEIRNII